ncbi:hypothetical protein B4135_0956 [Caldibacillus debilis]|uniref:Transposase DDE domain-containing protein n=1 Tax=Caldibacillus debilis TaxID=301148 RepID=A0A150M642_9BACI|nr:hypothetical protein B4135_0956 [Caldibacillus debilis]
MTQLPHPYTLGDKGYVSQALQKKLYDEYKIAFLDACSEKSTSCAIKKMETMDEAKTQNRRNCVLGFSGFISDYGNSCQFGFWI